MPRLRKKRPINKKLRKFVKRNKRRVVKRARSTTRSSRASNGSYQTCKPSRNVSKTSVNTEVSGATKDPPTVWENIVIHYLSKLRKVWQKKENDKQPEHPVKGNREDVQSTFKRENLGDRKARVIKNVVTSTHPQPDKYSSKSKIILDGVKRKSETGSSMGYDCYEIGKRKVLNIVSKALDYGLAHGIVCKSGRYYWLNHNNRFKSVAGRIPTPRPKSRKTVNRQILKKNISKNLSRKNKTKRRKPKRSASSYKRRSYSTSTIKQTTRKTSCNCPKCRPKRYYL